MFSENLKYYRQRNKLSQEELASLVGLTKMAISNYENGKREADSTTLIKLSKVLGVQPVDLAVNYAYAACITHGSFRKQSSVGKKSVEHIYDQIDRYLGKFAIVMDILGTNCIPSASRFNKVLKFTDIEFAGKEMRKFLYLPKEGPVGNVIDILEDNGIIVCQIEADTEFSGLNGTINGRPYIAVNINMTVERQRFTLIHELVHIIFDLSNVDDEEKCVDGITGAFLFPEDSVFRELGIKRTDIRMDLKYLQRKYGISLQSIIVRARQLKIISDASYKKHQKWLSENKKFKQTCSQTIFEESDLFERLVARALSEGKINITKASELLSMPSDTIKSKLLFKEAF